MASGQLTNREREVLGYLRSGATNDEIAGALSISVATVKTHVKNVRRKLGIKGRARAGFRLPHVPMEITPNGYGLSPENAYSEDEALAAYPSRLQFLRRIPMAGATITMVMTLGRRWRLRQPNGSFEGSPLEKALGFVLGASLTVLLIPVILVAVPVAVFLAILVAAPVSAVRSSRASGTDG